MSRLTIDGTVAPTRCCALLDLALSRSAPAGGLTIAHSLTGGPERLVLNFKRAPRGDRSQYASVSSAECRFCPFCGQGAA